MPPKSIKTTNSVNDSKDTEPEKVVDCEENKVVKPKKSRKTEKVVETDKVVKPRKSKKTEKVVEPEIVEPEIVGLDKTNKDDKVVKKKVVRKSKKTDNVVEPETVIAEPVISTLETECKVISKINVESEPESECDSKLYKISQHINNIPDPIANENNTNLEILLDEKKKEWAIITAQINTLNQDRDRLELEQKNLVKELTELMNKLQNDDVSNSFVLEQTNMVNKKEIIAMDADSDSSDSNSESESDSESKATKVSKPKLNCKKQNKQQIKTTKGHAITKEKTHNGMATDNNTLECEKLPVKNTKKFKKNIDVESSDDDSD
jgi:hypothetical protein